MDDAVLFESTPHLRFSLMLLERIGKLEETTQSIKSIIEQSTIEHVCGTFYIPSNVELNVDILKELADDLDKIDSLKVAAIRAIFSGGGLDLPSRRRVFVCVKLSRPIFYSVMTTEILNKQCDYGWAPSLSNKIESNFPGMVEFARSPAN